MPGTSKARNPRGIEIVFTEDDHKYRSVIDGQDIRYISGTQFLGKFYPQFDPDGKIVARCAAKEGITPAEMKARWDAKGRESCRLGTRMHETIEDTLQHRKLRNTAENTIEQLRFDKAIAIANKINERIDVLGIEKIVFSDRLRIAGTIDLFGKVKERDTYVIIDHKSNQSIDKENRYGNVCLDPIKHIPDTNFYHYALQLSLYEYLLKYEGYVDKKAEFKLYLNHVTPEHAKLIEVPSLQSEIRDLMIETLLRSQSEHQSQCLA